MDSLQIQDLNCSIKKKQILKNINLTIPTNSIFGFVGPNGAGKTTTIKCIIGQLPFQSGQISYKGKDIRDHQTKIGFVPDEAIFYEHLSGIEHLIYFGQLSKLDKKTAKEKGLELLKKLGLEDSTKIKVKNYSKGMKQRLGIAIALINNPEILILDEAMNGLDPLGRNLLKKIFQNLKKQGKTIFFSSHILSDVEEISDNFAIIHKGEIIQSPSTKNLDQNLEKLFIKLVNKS